MAFVQTQLPTPSDTPKNMELEDSEPNTYPHHSTTWTPIDSMTPISTNPSRKRSRDDNFEIDDGSYFPQQLNTPAPIPEEPIYGEGMTLLNPSNGTILSAESQTGTWYEEKAEEIAKTTPPAEFRPKLPASRKSIRLSQSSIKVHLDNIQPYAPASPPKSNSSHPEIDEATIALGIGWTRLNPEDEVIQTAARGWARYLENHYARHIHGAEILLKSSGLNAYLVGSQEGFYLFSEDLLEGQLVSRTWEGCLANLRSQPVTFEGDQVLRAERTPGPDISQSDDTTEKMQNWADFNRLNSIEPVVENGGMDLD